MQQEPLVQPVLRVQPQPSPDHKAHRAHREHKDRRGQLAPQGLEDSKEFRVSKVLLGLQVHRDQ